MNEKKRKNKYMWEEALENISGRCQECQTRSMLEGLQAERASFFLAPFAFARSSHFGIQLRPHEQWIQTGTLRSKDYTLSWFIFSSSYQGIRETEREGERERKELEKVFEPSTLNTNERGNIIFPRLLPLPSYLFSTTVNTHLFKNSFPLPQCPLPCLSFYMK